MNKIFIFVILVLFITVNLSGTQKKITFVVYDDNPIILKVSKKLYTEAFKRLGYQYRQIWHPPARAYRELTNGNVDGDIARISLFLKNNPYVVKVNTVIDQIDVYAYFLDNKLMNNNFFQGVKKNIRFGFIRGLFYIKYVQQKYHINNYLLVSSYGQLFKLLLSNRVRVIISTKEGFAQILKRSSVPVYSKKIYSFKLYPYLSVKHKNLAPKLARVLRQMKRDGTFQKIMAPLWKIK